MGKKDGKRVVAAPAISDARQARREGGISLINILSVLVGILSIVAMFVANSRFNTFGKLFMIITHQNTGKGAMSDLFSSQVIHNFVTTSPRSL